MRRPKSPRRSLLFTPGDSQRKIEKASKLETDAIIFDLEDAVAISEKETARETVCRALSELDFGGKETLVRLNGTATPFFAPDLLAVAPVRPHGIVIPKVEGAEPIAALDRRLAEIEAEGGWPVGSIRLLALIETALGVMNVKEIAQATPRLDALVFGAEDFAADIGALRSLAGWEIFYARSAVVTAAGAYDLQAIDTVYIDTRDLDGLRQDAEFARALGFCGKLAIHPGQLETINAVFSPSAAEIAAAQRLIKLAGDLQDAGAGVFIVEGRMIDAPLVLAAERLLERARLAGLIDGGSGQKADVE